MAEPVDLAVAPPVAPADAPAATAKRLPVIFADGKRGTIGPEDADALRALGGTVLTDAEAHHQALVNKYGTTGGQLKAAALGGLAGATMGLSDIALTKSGLISPETRKGLEEANPTTSTVAEVAGNIAPLLASGGTSAAAKAVSKVGFAVRGAGYAGEKVGELVARQFVKAGVRADSAHLLARAAARAIPQAIGSASEGALYGAAQAADEHALGEPGTLAEKLIANVGLASMFGGAVGGVAGLATGSLAKAAMHEVHAPKLGGLADDAAREVPRETGGAGEAVASGLDADTAAAAITTDNAPLAEAADNASAMPTTEESVLAPGQPSAHEAPLVDPNSPEAVRAAAAQAKVALDHGAPPTPETPGSSLLDSELAAAGAAKGADPGFIGRLFENISGTKVGEGVTKQWIKASAAMTSAKESTIAKFMLGPEAKANRALATGADEAIDDASRTMVKQFNEFGGQIDSLEDLTRGKAKVALMGRLIPKGNEELATQRVMNMVGDVRAQLNKLAEDPTANKTYLERAHKTVNAYEAKMLDLATNPVPGGVVEKHGLSAALFEQADALKREMGHRMYGSLKKSLAPGDRETAMSLADIYTKTLKPALEDEKVWGAAGVAQAEQNIRWNKMLATQRYVKDDFLQVYGDKLDGTGRNFVADPAKNVNFLRNLSDPANDVKLTRLREHLRDKLDFLTTAEKHGGWDDAQKALHQKARANANAMLDTLDNVEKSVAAKNQLEQLTKGSIAFNQSGAGLAGLMLGGPIGGLIGMATGSVVSPAKVIRQLAMMDKLVAKTDDAIGHSLDDALGISMGNVSHSGRAAAEASMDGAAHVHRPHEAHSGHGFMHRAEEAARRVGDHAVEAVHAIGHEEAREEARGEGVASRAAKAAPRGHAHPTTVRRLTEPPVSAPPQRSVGGFTGPTEVLIHAIGGGRFDAKDEDAGQVKSMGVRMENFNRLQRMLQRSITEMPATMDRLHRNTQTLNDVAPQTAAAVAMTAANAVQFLNDKMPKPDQSPLPEALRRPFTPSEEDMDRLDRYARVIDDPLSAVTDLGQGRLSYEAVDALKTVYPQVYGTIVSKAMEKLEGADRPVPYSTKVQLGLLLGVPIDDSMSPASLQFVATGGVSAPPAPTPPAGPPGGAPSPGGRINTGALSKLEKGGRLASRNQGIEADL